MVAGRFWAQALGLTLETPPSGEVRLTGPTPAHTVWVNEVPEPKLAKYRVHLDVHGGSVDEMLGLGAAVVDDTSFRWVVMTDPEGAEFCLFRRDEVPVVSPPRTRRRRGGPSGDRVVVGRRARRHGGRRGRRELLVGRGHPECPVRRNRVRHGARAQDRQEPGAHRRRRRRHPAAPRRRGDAASAPATAGSTGTYWPIRRATSSACSTNAEQGRPAPG